MNPFALTIIGYLLLVTLLGAVLAKRNRSSSDWATASGGMGIWMIAAGIAGTRIGGTGSYGVAGDVMSGGVWNAWYGVNTFLALALVGLFFAIPYRRLGLTTISELFIRRFGRSRSGVLTSLCVQTEYLFVNVIEPLLIGIIISSIIEGIDLWLGILIGAAVIISATAFSGLKGTGLTNIVHCTVIIFGLLTVGIVAMNQLGGWSMVVERADAALAAADMNHAKWWSIVGAGWFPIIAMFFSAVIHTPAASIYVNYSTSAKRESILIPAFLLAGAIAALMPFLSAVIGIEALAKYGANAGISSYRTITQIAMDTGPIIGGIALAAVLAALISSGGPILLASSTMFINDWVPASKRFTPTQKLTAYRITSVIYGLVAAGIACFFGYVVGTASILQWLLLGFAMVVPPAIAIGFIFYVKVTDEKAVFWGIATGYAFGLAAWLINETLLNLSMDIAAYFTTILPLIVIPNMSLLLLSRVGAKPPSINTPALLLFAAVVSFPLLANSLLSGLFSLGVLKAITAASPIVTIVMYTYAAPRVTQKGLFWGILSSYVFGFGWWHHNQGTNHHDIGP